MDEFAEAVKQLEFDAEYVLNLAKGWGIDTNPYSFNLYYCHYIP